MPTPNQALATVMAQAVVDEMSSATVRILDGATTLAEVTLPATAGTVSNGVITWDCDPDLVDSSINASGTADGAEIDNGSGDVLDLTVGVGSGDLQLDTLTFVSGGTFTLESLTTTVPNTGA